MTLKITKLQEILTDQECTELAGAEKKWRNTDILTIWVFGLSIY
jgi:hypothetical protein